MTRAEKNNISKWARSLTDEELEARYYREVLNCLGSEAEKMYELGYDMADVYAQEEHEHDQCVLVDILEGVCAERGIELWKEETT